MVQCKLHHLYMPALAREASAGTRMPGSIEAGSGGGAAAKSSKEVWQRLAAQSSALYKSQSMNGLLVRSG